MDTANIDRLAKIAGELLPGLDGNRFKQDAARALEENDNLEMLMDAALHPTPDIPMVKGVIMAIAKLTGGNPAEVLDDHGPAMLN